MTYRSDSLPYAMSAAKMRKLIADTDRARKLARKEQCSNGLQNALDRVMAELKKIQRQNFGIWER